MYRMARNAQLSPGAPGVPTGGDGGFFDQQCGIAASQAGTAVVMGTESGARNPTNPAAI
jgi:hypothetical protein